MPSVVRGQDESWPRAARRRHMAAQEKGGPQARTVILFLILRLVSGGDQVQVACGPAMPAQGDSSHDGIDVRTNGHDEIPHARALLLEREGIMGCLQ